MGLLQHYIDQAKAIVQNPGAAISNVNPTIGNIVTGAANSVGMGSTNHIFGSNSVFHAVVSNPIVDAAATVGGDFLGIPGAGVLLNAVGGVATALVTQGSGKGAAQAGGTIVAAGIGKGTAIQSTGITAPNSAISPLVWVVGGVAAFLLFFSGKKRR